MNLSPAIAKDIIITFKGSLDCSLDFYNSEGKSVGSSSEKTQNEFKEWATNTIKTGKETIINSSTNRLGHPKMKVIFPLSIDGLIVGAVGISGKSQHMVSYISLVKKMAEGLIKSHLLDMQSQLTTEARQSLIYNLIFHKSNQMDTPLTQQASTIGINLSKLRTAILMNINGIEESESFAKDKTKILAIITSLVSGSPDYLTAYVGESNFVVFYPIQPQEDIPFRRKLFTRICNNIKHSLRNHFSSQITIGVGSIVHTSTILRNSFNESLEAMSVAINSDNNDKFHFWDDLGLDLILNNISNNIAHNYVTGIVGAQKQAVTALLGSDLLHTLEVFFECNLNISETARSLFVHRNTLLYRLDKTYKLTKRDPRVFSEAMELKIFIQLLKFHSVKL